MQFRFEPHYPRVIPRDLFNEALLLKCIGRLTLLIHDCEIRNITFEYDDHDNGFSVTQDGYDGSIYIDNISFYLDGCYRLHFYTPMNSRNDPYPLLLDFNENIYEVFDQNGNYIIENLKYEK